MGKTRYNQNPARQRSIVDAGSFASRIPYLPDLEVLNQPLRRMGTPRSQSGSFHSSKKSWGDRRRFIRDSLAAAGFQAKVWEGYSGKEEADGYLGRVGTARWVAVLSCEYGRPGSQPTGMSSFWGRTMRSGTNGGTVPPGADGSLWAARCSLP